MKLSKIIMGIALTVLILPGCKNSVETNVHTRTSNDVIKGLEDGTLKVKVSASEVYLTTDELIASSDLIIRGKVEDLKERLEKEVYDESGSKSQYLVSIYNLAADKIYKGSCGEKIELGFFMDAPGKMKHGVEYVFFLGEEKTTEQEDYHLTSLSDGFYIINDNVLESVVSKRKIKLDDITSLN